MSLLWNIVNTPLIVLLTVPQFVAIRVLYEGRDPSITASWFPDPVPALPEMQSAAGFVFGERSILLVLLVLALNILRWYASRLPVSALGRPKGIPRSTFISALIVCVLMYWLLGAATVYFACVSIFLYAARELFVATIFRPLLALVRVGWRKARSVRLLGEDAGVPDNET